MNDFTKEELKKIHGLLVFCCDEPFREPNSTFELRDKIQSMIDNYCEHEYGEKSVELHVKQCCKCQEVKVL